MDNRALSLLLVATVSLSLFVTNIQGTTTSVPSVSTVTSPVPNTSSPAATTTSATSGGSNSTTVTSSAGASGGTGTPVTSGGAGTSNQSVTPTPGPATGKSAGNNSGDVSIHGASLLSMLAFVFMVLMVTKRG